MNGKMDYERLETLVKEITEAIDNYYSDMREECATVAELEERIRHTNIYLRPSREGLAEFIDKIVQYNLREDKKAAPLLKTGITIKAGGK